MKALLPVLFASTVLMSEVVSGAEPSKPTAASTTQSKPKPAPATPSGSAKTESAPAAASGEKLYTVKDGNKVDPKTLQGWKTWRALACERCHGAEQEGLVGPALRDTIKTISKEDFHKLMQTGRPEKGMPPFVASKMVMDNWEGLYAYLRGRSDGQIQPGRLSPLDSK